MYSYHHSKAQGPDNSLTPGPENVHTYIYSLFASESIIVMILHDLSRYTRQMLYCEKIMA